MNSNKSSGVSLVDQSTQYFLSALSHDIRTPLNGIVGYTELLSKTKLDKTQQSYVTSMSHCCIQLVELVNDVLEFSKLATNRAQINNECFSFQEMIDEINSAITYRIKEKKHTLKYILSEKLPQYIYADKQKIIQVLVNLISNANKFTPIEVGKITVLISPLEATAADTEVQLQPQKQKQPAGGKIQFVVEDNGIGIDVVHQDRLFQPFYQVQDSVTRNGYGLGLAICKKTIEFLQGDISVVSEKGRGSKFSFTIKYEKCDDTHKILEKNIDLLRGKNILIVDDNVDNRLILSELFFECRMNPVMCSSAVETLRIVHRYPFVCALIDICMPDLSGTQLASQIKELNASLPLIALSSLDGPFDTSRFTHVVTKPFNKLKLLNIICKVAGKHDISAFELIPHTSSNSTIVTPVQKQDVKTSNNKSDKSDPKERTKVLIAEDVIYNLDLTSKMLASMGYKSVHMASSGREAIDKLETEAKKGVPFDVLLLDLKMPEVDGLGVAKYLQTDKWAWKVPKIVVLSASVLETDRKACAALGIQYFIVKPVNMTNLSMIMDRLVLL